MASSSLMIVSLPDQAYMQSSFIFINCPSLSDQVFIWCCYILTDCPSLPDQEFMLYI